MYLLAQSLFLGQIKLPKYFYREKSSVSLLAKLRGRKSWLWGIINLDCCIVLRLPIISMLKLLILQNITTFCCSHGLASINPQSSYGKPVVRHVLYVNLWDLCKTIFLSLIFNVPTIQYIKYVRYFLTVWLYNIIFPKNEEFEYKFRSLRTFMVKYFIRGQWFYTRPVGYNFRSFNTLACLSTPFPLYD